jgi:hypothetical protein
MEREKTMHTKLTNKRTLALTMAVVVGVGMMSPAWAATKMRSHARAAAEAQQQIPADAYNQAGSRSGVIDQTYMAPNAGQGYRCMTDDGYGRMSDCAYSGGN